jgi:hypothetical protein
VRPGDGGRDRAAPLAADLRAIETYAQDIVDTVREPLLILDSRPARPLGNRAFYQTFHVSSEETENRLIYELGNGQWDIPALRTLLEDIVPKSSVFNDFELEHDFPHRPPGDAAERAQAAAGTATPSCSCWRWKTSPSAAAPREKWRRRRKRPRPPTRRRACSSPT